MYVVRLLELFNSVLLELPNFDFFIGFMAVLCLFGFMNLITLIFN